MKGIEVKTKIMGGSCVSMAYLFLNNAFGENSWKVDPPKPNKVLTVTTRTLSDADVISSV